MTALSSTLPWLKIGLSFSQRSWLSRPGVARGGENKEVNQYLELKLELLCTRRMVKLWYLPHSKRVSSWRYASSFRNRNLKCYLQSITHSESPWLSLDLCLAFQMRRFQWHSGEPSTWSRLKYSSVAHVESVVCIWGALCYRGRKEVSGWRASQFTWSSFWRIIINRLGLKGMYLSSYCLQSSTCTRVHRKWWRGKQVAGGVLIVSLSPIRHDHLI